MNIIETKILNSKEECNNLLNKTAGGITILHINICSINKHFEKLIVLIQELQNNHDVIICYKTRQINIELYNLTGYTAHYNEGSINQNDEVI